MDTLENFSPVDTSKFNFLESTSSIVRFRLAFNSNLCIAGFINVNAIRLKKYGLQKLEEGNSLTKV